MTEPGEIELPEEAAKFLQALREDEELRAWFVSFDHVPEPVRHREFHQLAHQMQEAGEHAELVNATAMLAHEAIYRAVRAAV